MTSNLNVLGENEKNEKMSQQFALQKIKEKMEQLKIDTAAQINDQLEKMVTEIINGLEEKEMLAGQIQNLFSNKNSNNDEIQDKIKTTEGRLPDKHFMSRNSLLTDLFEIKHIQTIYHIFLALLFGLFVNTTASDLIYKGKTHMGFELIVRGFKNLHMFIYVWICMFLSTFLIYVGLHRWATIRIQLFPKSIKLKLWDRLFLVLYVLYSIVFVYHFTNSVVINNLTTAESVGILCELTRFLMKIHAFVRSNVPRALQYKQHAEDQISCPEFSKFLYFLFAPTLIYKDDYPRTKTVRWNYVFKCFVEVMGCIFYISFIIECFLIPELNEFGSKEYKWQDIVLIILGNSTAGILILLSTFYAILHAWMNGFAEMLRFGDRMFYKDWWTSTSYGRYYRTWNVVVHDWLYTYIYKDVYENVLPNNKIVAKLMVFFVSAVFHEFILGFGFGFFYPVLFILFFGFGVAVSFLKSNNNSLGNSGVWYGLALGMGIAASTYCMEYYARVNCPIENKTVLSYFIPRSFSCNPQK